MKLKKIWIALCSILLGTLIPILPGLVKSADLPILSTAPSFSQLKSVDVMKYTKDVMANQPSDATINNLVGTLATMPITHVSIAVPMDASGAYPAASQPAPNNAYVFTQKWADAIHSHGLHIIWRGTWAGIEGIYNFPQQVGNNRFPSGTAQSAVADGTSTWLGKTYLYIVDHPTFFADGDVWAPLPERTEGIFQDATSFLPYSGAGIQANYASFFKDLKQTSDSAFSRIGINLITGMSANNYTEIMSTWMDRSLIDSNGVIAIDYYGNTHTPQEMDYDLRRMATLYNHPIYLQEWADYWNNDFSMSAAQRTLYLQSMYDEMQKLVNDGILIGFNYWGGWDNGTEGILSRDGTNPSSNFLFNYRGELLNHLFANNDPPILPPYTPPDSPPPIPAPTPTLPPSLSCPAPGEGVFTGCYYSDQNLNNLVFVRSDAALDFDWGSGAPAPNIPADHFSVIWEGNFGFNRGNYTFNLTNDDDARLYIDGRLVLQKGSGSISSSSSVYLSLADGTHTIRMEYIENAGDATAKLSWNQNLAGKGRKLR